MDGIVWFTFFTSFGAHCNCRFAVCRSASKKNTIIKWKVTGGTYGIVMVQYGGERLYYQGPSNRNSPSMSGEFSVPFQYKEDGQLVCLYAKGGGQETPIALCLSVDLDKEPPVTTRITPGDSTLVAGDTGVSQWIVDDIPFVSATPCFNVYKLWYPLSNLVIG